MATVFSLTHSLTRSLALSRVARLPLSLLGCAEPDSTCTLPRRLGRWNSGLPARAQFVSQFGTSYMPVCAPRVVGYILYMGGGCVYYCMCVHVNVYQCICASHYVRLGIRLCVRMSQSVCERVRVTGVRERVWVSRSGLCLVQYPSYAVALCVCVCGLSNVRGGSAPDPRSPPRHRLIPDSSASRSHAPDARPAPVPEGPGGPTKGRGPRGCGPALPSVSCTLALSLSLSRSLPPRFRRGRCRGRCRRRPLRIRARTRPVADITAAHHHRPSRARFGRQPHHRAHRPSETGRYRGPPARPNRRGRTPPSSGVGAASAVPGSGAHPANRRPSPGARPFAPPSPPPTHSF